MSIPGNVNFRNLRGVSTDLIFTSNFDNGALAGTTYDYLRLTEPVSKDRTGKSGIPVSVSPEILLRFLKIVPFTPKFRQRFPIWLPRQILRRKSGRRYRRRWFVLARRR